MKYVLTYGILIFFFISTLFASALIPSTFLNKQVKASIETFTEEGTYPSFGLPWRQIVLDNFTDSLMFNTAYSVNSERSFQSILLNRRYEESIDQIGNLKVIYEENAVPQTNYERYWHGYLVYLRPLLALTSYTGLRLINAIFLYGGFAYLLYLIWKKLGREMVVAMIISFVLVDFFFIWKSLQFSSVFQIAIYSSIYLLKNYQKNGSYYIFFFIIGGLTSFFDLLTAPLITLGLPLILVTYMNRLNVKKVFFLCISWSIGYLLLWASKWIIVELCISPGAIQTSIDQILKRTVTKADPEFSHLVTIKRNLLQLIGYHKSNKIIMLVGTLAAALFFWRYGSFKNVKLNLVVPFAFIAIIPYAWYLVAANHSYIHVWFTYRIQLLAVLAMLLIYLECIDWGKVKNHFLKYTIRKTPTKDKHNPAT